MFAGNSELLYPFTSRVTIKLAKTNDEKKLAKAYTIDRDLEEIEDVCVSVYRSLMDRYITSEYLAKIGYSSIDDFRLNGLAQLGGEIFSKYIEKIESFDLGIEFIVYGFDRQNNPHIISIENPGRVRNHRTERFAVIGSGTYVARAALHRKDLSADIESVIYRLMDAKFSAEFTSGVGKGTSVITLKEDGKFGIMQPRDVRAIREIWDEMMKSHEPTEAVEVIHKSHVYWAVTGDGRPPRQTPQEQLPYQQSPKGD
jgi:hypothetical protein